MVVMTMGPVAGALAPRGRDDGICDGSAEIARVGAGATVRASLRSCWALGCGRSLRPLESAQYTALWFTDHLALQGIAPSVGSVGDAYDTALMESVIGLFKTECIRTTVFHAGPYKTVSDVEYATAGWVDRWNNRRLHGTLGMISPNEAEQTHYAALIPQEQPV